MVRLLVAIVAVLAARSASAEMIAGGGGEFLVLETPEGWVSAHVTREPDMSFNQFVPEGESFEAWSEAVQAQVFHGQQALSPADFLANIHRIYVDGCDDVDAGPIDSREVTGYEVAGRVLLCGKDKVNGEGEVAMFKVMKGAAGLYAVNRAWRGPAFDPAAPPLDEAVMDAWASYFGAVRLCDDRNRLAPCTAPEDQ